MQVTEVAIESIQVVGRYRKDLGDLTTLAESISNPMIGLINPITLTRDHRIVAGERRLRACQLLGWTHIEARIIDTLDDAAAFLRAELEENTERKEMTVSEKVALAKALEEIEKPRAEQRRREGQERARKARRGEPPTGLAPAGANPGKSADIAGAAAGLSVGSYFRAKAVVEAVHHPDSGVREVAKAAMAEMDATNSIANNYEKVRAARARVEAGPSVLPEPVTTPAHQQRKVLANAEMALSGICYGLKQVEGIHPDITSEEAAQWVGSLSETRRVLESLIKRLKERSNARA